MQMLIALRRVYATNVEKDVYKHQKLHIVDVRRICSTLQIAASAVPQGALMSIPTSDRNHSRLQNPRLEPRSESDLGWAGGFIDGEGCIHIAKQRYVSRATCSYRLGVFITQNDKSVLEHLRQVVGIYAPIFAVKRADNHKRQCFTLNYTGKNALRLLALLRDFLVRKRAEAKAALDFWTEGRMDERFGIKGVSAGLTATREHYFQLMKQLK
jgi:hypothetical protein